MTNRISRPSTVRALAGASVLALSAAIALSASPTTAAAQSQATINFNIPAFDLNTALRAFSEQSRVQLVYSSPIATNRRAPALRAAMTADRALAALLAGSGLTYRFNDASTVTITVPLAVAAGDAGDIELGTVRVEGTEGAQYRPARGSGVAQLGGERGRQDDEADGYRSIVSSVVSGAPEALGDTPRSITVQTQEEIRTQDIRTIGDVLTRLPGVTYLESPRSGVTGADIFVRGNPLTAVQIDGGAARRLSLVGNGQLNLDAYERVELVRGSNGGQIGEGSVGGSLNLVRKRPGDEESLSLGGRPRQLGASRSFRPTIPRPPSRGRLSPSGVSRVASETDQFYENNNTKNLLLYGLFDAPLGDASRLEFGFQLARSEQNGGYQGVPRYIDGPLFDVPFDYNFVPDFAYSDVDRFEIFSNYYQDISDKWRFSAGFSYEDLHHESVQIGQFARINSQGLVLPGSSLQATEYIADPTQIGADLKLFGQVETWGFTHNLYAGVSYNQSDGGLAQNGARSAYRPVFTSADIDPDGWPPLSTTSVPITSYESRANWTAVFSDTISWRDKVDLGLSVSRTGGANYNVYLSPNSSNVSYFIGETASPPERDEEWLPTYSISVKPIDSLTIYASQSQGNIAQDGYFTLEGATLGARVFQNDELGLKYFRGGWLLSAAAYWTEDTNVAEAIPGSEGQCPPTPLSTCYLSAGATQTSEGFDLELVGRLGAGLSVAANFNYNKNENTFSNLPQIVEAPSESGRVLIDWRPPSFDRLNLNLSATYRGKVAARGGREFYDDQGQFVSYVPIDYAEGSYVLIDLGVGYRVTPQVELSLRAENVTDVQYYSTVLAQGAFAGAPRSFLATLRWSPEQSGIRSGKAVVFGDPADWYGAFDVGIRATDDLKARAQGAAADGVTPVMWNIETLDHEVMQARLGYRWTDSVRFELEAGRRSSSFGRIDGGAAAPTGVCGARDDLLGVAFDCSSNVGGLGQWSFMANAMYDFASPDAPLRPFIGAGIGAVRNDIRFAGKLAGIGQDTPWGFDANRALQESIVVTDTSVDLAIQGMAGVSWKVNNQVNVDLTYRFFRTPDLNWSSYNFSSPDYPNVPPLLGPLGEFESAVEEHSLSIGLRWSFGPRD